MRTKALFCIVGIPFMVYAHDTTIQTSYETLAFQHSKKKDDGKRYGIMLSHKEDNSHYLFSYEKTETKTL